MDESGQPLDGTMVQMTAPPIRWSQRMWVVLPVTVGVVEGMVVNAPGAVYRRESNPPLSGAAVTGATAVKTTDTGGVPELC